MLQIQPDLAALVRFLQAQGINHSADEDLGYAFHAWLAAAFGDLAPRPFRLFVDRSGQKPTKLLAYTLHPRDTLIERAELAEPVVRVVCDLDVGMAVARMAEHWRPEQLFGFDLLACPVARKSATGMEKDLYLQRADHATAEMRMDRAEVYGAWVRKHLDGAASVETVALEGFRLVRQLRRPAGTAGRDETRLVRPQALMRGTLRVVDSDMFCALLSRGIGRHRAFGYGMLLLKPAV
jgi:CRISPR system Cascade subunit CasE